ncbi:hypothetical protein AB0K71_05845 [Streptomyces syringium]|uniref:hypothetical protein n=1 Tax=Streptomyces syringium TaxID=76729 RepID=UPI003433C030
MKQRIVWWASLALIGTAAAGMTAWSLYVVAHDIYGVPSILAAGTSIVFDGAAIACLHLAGEATRERRSAFGPHCATLALASVSVYLNHLSAQHIHGGAGAFVLFATPTVALLLLAGLSWSATRARLRADGGERPVTLPRYGLFGWLLASEEAWKATKQRAVSHVTGGSPAPAESKPAKSAAAVDRLSAHFASMDTAEAIRFASSALPTATPQQLADELGLYGIRVTPVGVALVLGYEPPTTKVERPAPVGTQTETLPPPEPPKPLTSADILSGQCPDKTAAAARQLISLGITDKAKAVPLIIDALRLDPRRQSDSVRRAFERELKATAQPPEGAPKQLSIDGQDEGGGFYP